MKQNKPLALIAVLLVISIANYSLLSANENIRTVQFLSILAIGMLAGILLRGIIGKFKGRDVQ